MGKIIEIGRGTLQTIKQNVQCSPNTTKTNCRLATKSCVSGVGEQLYREYISPSGFIPAQEEKGYIQNEYIERSLSYIYQVTETSTKPKPNTNP